MNPGQPAIELRDVTISAMRDVTLPVLANVTWTVAPGEFWVLAGQPHAGKTDFLMLTAGLMPPLAGSCRLFGRETRSVSEAELNERPPAGFVFAGGQLFSQMTIAENIALPLRYHRDLDADEAERETRGVLELFELAPLAGLAPAEVSRDWLKRAALARSLVLRPQLLFCDDPLHGLGARHRQWWLQFLDQLNHGHDQLGGQPVTLVVATEDLLPWKNPARRFAVLRDKQFFPLGTWADLEKSGDPLVGELLATPPQTTLQPLN